MRTRLICFALLAAAGCSGSSGPSAPVQHLDWDSTAVEYRAEVGKTLKLTCPLGGFVAEVWGTDVYTDDSAICTAAVHAGKIGLDEGGEVTIRIREGVDGYAGSTRNRITTGSYGGWRNAFSFED